MFDVIICLGFIFALVIFVVFVALFTSGYTFKSFSDLIKGFVISLKEKNFYYQVKKNPPKMVYVDFSEKIRNYPSYYMGSRSTSVKSEKFRETDYYANMKKYRGVDEKSNYYHELDYSFVDLIPTIKLSEYDLKKIKESIDLTKFEESLFLTSEMGYGIYDSALKIIDLKSRYNKYFDSLNDRYYADAEIVKLFNNKIDAAIEEVILGLNSVLIDRQREDDEVNLKTFNDLLND